jgi:hypothetical protein
LEFLNVFIIYVVIDFSENLKDLWMSFKKRMDSLWTFEMMTLCLSHIENENFELKKNVKVISKSKLKNRPP